MSSYLVLARKYRSRTFDEVVGQEAISRTLVNAVKTGRIHHAYLFTGTRGVGKTTMARILAKALNCLAADAPTPEPCNECDACVSIARGDDVDVVEIDGASNRGIDEIRDLRANAIFRPARCRYKVYYIDEVHMLTLPAFNALLKTLEEPPEHVKFIFSTTEAEKVPATILSRCQRFDFRNIPTQRIAEHLQRICEAENVQADGDALFRIARAAAGSMRDALSLLDQLLVSDVEVTAEDVVRVLGTPPDERMLAIAEAIANGSPAAALGELDGVLASGVSLAGAAAALGDVFRNMMVASTCGADSELIELPEQQRKALGEIARRFSMPALVQAVGVCQSVSQRIRGSSVARGLLEAALVRLADAEKFVDPASLIDRLEALSGGEGAAGQKKKPIAIGRPGGGRGQEHAGAREDPRHRSAGASGAGASRAGESGAAASGAGRLRQNGAPVESASEADRDRAVGDVSGRLATLSTAERNHLAKDPAVKAAADLFGGQVVDIRLDPTLFETPPADGEENEEQQGEEDDVGGE